MQNLKGFRDFFPEEMAQRNYLFEAFRRVAVRFGFVEYDGPPLELLELYTKKSGDEIVNQLYNFEDKGGRAGTGSSGSDLPCTARRRPPCRAGDSRLTRN